MKRLWAFYSGVSWDKKILLGAVAVAIFPIAAGLMFQAQPDPPPHRQSVDTYIPKGFVLVPIEVQNYEALDSVLGKFGIVDLFQVKSSGAGLVARNVRLLRAPQNPAHFAVLVPEAQTREILKFGGTFTVTVKRPNKDGTEFVKSESAAHRSITYERD